MQIILLTHSREISKTSNTGQLVEQVVPLTRKIIWQRTAPDDDLLKLIESGNTALLYPSEGIQNYSQETGVLAEFENFILIDSTWQEARKIFNRSQYLQQLPRIQLSVTHASKYALRRNQVEGGLCTAECAIELLKQRKQIELAEALNLRFTKFINSAR